MAKDSERVCSHFFSLFVFKAQIKFWGLMILMHMSCLFGLFHVLF
ncbi:hypothetical protein LCAZH_0544 [Lacticaseibacillus paracasei]|nr:hypothetical protein LCAZH_0544 [Lacticaseibacillus paracasei]AGP67458.1 Hypothetical protein LOCK919_0715 [Lacticaseibacillus paracasei]